MRKIAVPVNEKNELDAHFGHCKYFILADVEDKSIVKTEKVPAPPHEPGLLPKWLGEKAATDIIAGGMGQQAINLFMQNKINVFVGAPTMEASELIKKFLNEELSFTSNYCNH
ncbi:NifB/NifX family molybdenum-iron cluster-binding protein [Geofilum sp. OHC36d9]|uniref:NifB/NifX family molybdenum-iron cluster-binding protein n=1 Tax=Geofilum sp. OHC36d9 TaxID=3458413 RepID=UPI004034704F